MEVAAALAAGASVLIYGARCLLVWGLAKQALKCGASLKISGLNPLAPHVEIRPGISSE